VTAEAANDLSATRTALQRVAVHVLARRRHAATGRVGLRATPGGFGTPSFGAPGEPEVLRVSGTNLVHEVDGDLRSVSVPGSTLADLAGFAGADLAAEFSVGHDTPPLGDVGEPIAVDGRAAGELAAWLDLGWRVLDEVATSAERPTTAQLWPEHFDAACSVAIGPRPDDRVNLGVSLGDGFSPEPYLYVGPWTDARPGDPAYWNAPFGAVLARSNWVSSTDDGVQEGAAFFRRGIELLRLKG
jgi:hypothetical protein